jgi:hypothetical protein
LSAPSCLADFLFSRELNAKPRHCRHGEPKKFWKGVDPKTGKRGIFPKNRVSVLSKAIAIEDLMVPGPHFLKLKKHDVVVICGTVVKNRVVTGYTGFVEAFPGAIGNIALQSVVVDLEASHQAVEAKIRGRQPPPSGWCLACCNIALMQMSAVRIFHIR